MNEPLPARLRRIAREEVVLLLVPLGLLLAGALFFLIADAVRAGTTRDVDEQLLRAVRSADDPTLVWGSPIAAKVARDLTAVGSSVVLGLVSAAVAGYLALRRRWMALLVVAAASAGGGAISQLLKHLFQRPRPQVVPHLDHVGASFSFPSGHSMGAAVIYLTLGAMLARLTPEWRIKVYVIGVAALLAFLVGASRVALGVHYPSDVVAGWAGGFAWAAVCWLAVRALQARGIVPPPAAGWGDGQGQ